MKKTELLAPAGDIEAGYAALYYGADAVYLGLEKFSARATATNFSPEQLDEFCAYAHSLGKKVYVTINTVVKEEELQSLLETLDICTYCRVDAIILQDLGVAGIIKKSYPNLALHASTQMAVHNKEGALKLKELGFERVVLARELTFEQIAQIGSIKDLELEVFIHGALCYSYSGLCMFSSLTSAKSANRGKCLYPCRDIFSDGNKTGHFFSMKDLALQEDILKLNVASLKIEGRKKSALYVAAVTDYYRQILDGKKPSAIKEENIKQIFSRPWTKLHTKGHAKNVTDINFVGHRGLKIGKIQEFSKNMITFITNHQIAKYDGIQIDITGRAKPFGFSLEDFTVNGKRNFSAKPGDKICFKIPGTLPTLKVGQDIYLASSSKVKGAYDYVKPKPAEYKNRSKIDVCVQISSNSITATAQGKTIRKEGFFEVAKNLEKNHATIIDTFNKVGQVNFEPKLTIKNPDNLFIPVSVLNELRRSLYQEIQIERYKGSLPPVDVKQAVKQVKWAVKTDRNMHIDLSKIDELIVEISTDFDCSWFNKYPQEKVRIALPAICLDTSEYKNIINFLWSKGYHKWEVSNLWGISVLPDEAQISFGSDIYILNSQASSMAQKLGAQRICYSVEDNKENMTLLGKNSAISTMFKVFCKPRVFISTNCLRKNSCAECDKKEQQWTVSNKQGGYDVVSKNCQTSVYMQIPLCFGKEWSEVKADWNCIDFCGCTYNNGQKEQIIKQIQSGQDTDICQKANFYRQI